MPRPNTLAPAAEPAALTASAVSYPGKGKSKSAQRAGSHDSWQKEAWAYYDRVGELRYGSNWVANIASQAFLFAGKRDEHGNVVQSDSTATETRVLNSLFGGPEGQSQMLRSMTLHLTVAGEVYCLIRTPFEDEETEGKYADDDGMIYEVVGTEECAYRGDTWYVRQPNGLDMPLTEQDTLIRVWMPHPRDRSRPDSPVRGILNVLGEIVLYDAHIKAQSTSRLHGGGVMFLPSEMQLTPPKSLLDSMDEGATPSTADTFVWNLMEAMETARQSNGEPASVAPVVTTAPGEHISKIQLFKFWTDLDEKVVEMRQDAILRLARGMDLPPEVFLGTGDMNRWGAWQVEESSIKAHVEPPLNHIANVLTREFLKEYTDVEGVAIGVDTSRFRLRPNRSKEAVELYDRGVLSREALVRETGFADDDISDDQEFRRWLLHQMVQASWSPDQAQQAAKELGVDLRLPLGDNAPREARPTPSLKEHPTRDRPERSRSDPGWEPYPSEERAAAASAVAVLACRAMERAGNRLKSLSGLKPEGVKSTDVHTLITPYESRLDDLLKDAWDLSYVQHVDPREARAMISVANSYCRELLLEKVPFSVADLKTRLLEETSDG